MAASASGKRRRGGDDGSGVESYPWMHESLVSGTAAFPELSAFPGTAGAENYVQQCAADLSNMTFSRNRGRVTETRLAAEIARANTMGYQQPQMYDPSGGNMVEKARPQAYLIGDGAAAMAVAEAPFGNHKVNEAVRSALTYSDANMGAGLTLRTDLRTHGLEGVANATNPRGAPEGLPLDTAPVVGQLPDNMIIGNGAVQATNDAMNRIN